jgi:hypothetical protein
MMQLEFASHHAAHVMSMDSVAEVEIHYEFVVFVFMDRELLLHPKRIRVCESHPVTATAPEPDPGMIEVHAQFYPVIFTRWKAGVVNQVMRDAILQGYHIDIGRPTVKRQSRDITICVAEIQVGDMEYEFVDVFHRSVGDRYGYDADPGLGRTIRGRICSHWR